MTQIKKHVFSLNYLKVTFKNSSQEEDRMATEILNRKLLYRIVVIKENCITNLKSARIKYVDLQEKKTNQKNEKKIYEERLLTNEEDYNSSKIRSK